MVAFAYTSVSLVTYRLAPFSFEWRLKRQSITDNECSQSIVVADDEADAVGGRSVSDEFSKNQDALPTIFRYRFQIISICEYY